ncbi:hypothetical protein DdX_15052 [Ditylenchus destructor]|uniref:Uncharacterized protein n=1 Tax=Ditylenchus destructor TaxID=166010 RepID=A0AAD4QV46_9BILA|nr:hypothetical protein DdX_15052 [Ditylenchus destructor]
MYNCVLRQNVLSDCDDSSQYQHQHDIVETTIELAVCNTPSAANQKMGIDKCKRNFLSQWRCPAMTFLLSRSCDRDADCPPQIIGMLVVD